MQIKCNIAVIILILMSALMFCSNSFAGSKPEVTSHTAQAIDRALSVNLQWQSENPITSVKIFAGRTEKEIKIDEYDNHRNPAGYYGEISAVIPLDSTAYSGSIPYQIQLVDDLRQKSDLLSGLTAPKAMAAPGIAPMPGMMPQQGAMMPAASRQDDGWGKSNIMAGKGQGTQPGSNTSNNMIDKMLAVADRFDTPPSLDAIKINILGPENVSFTSKANDDKGIRDITFRVYDGVGNKVGEQVLTNLGKKWEGSTDSIKVTGSGPFRVTAQAVDTGGNTSKEQVATFNMGAPAPAPASAPAPAPAPVPAAPVAAQKIRIIEWGTIDPKCTSEQAPCIDQPAFTPSKGGYRAGGHVAWSFSLVTSDFSSISSMQLQVTAIGLWGAYPGNIDPSHGQLGNYLAIDGVPYTPFLNTTDGRDTRIFNIPILSAGQHTFAVFAYEPPGPDYDGWAGIDYAKLTITGLSAN